MINCTCHEHCFLEKSIFCLCYSEKRKLHISFIRDPIFENLNVLESLFHALLKGFFVLHELN